ncbi:glycoside hydrolase family 26 protein [Neolewinella agarilytica]|uniref:Mannan endo-1,4-beta-mannosidase n=1 Tax=Neolewinella agarilytica TaxID=478744 RepID=A0A1H9HQF7_9BACT|nr:glycosyl hydrolase [Neolewinella agarilytica]SEQ64518.1 mannan endo-1,4-beta-mannosidase [Neolewinella agarilytica]
MTANPNATRATRALFQNLRELAKTSTLFGHQDSLAYGVKWKDWHEFRTDISDVCGQHPAVFGWDLGWMGKTNHNLDDVPFKAMMVWMREVHHRGGINTVSWHMDNFHDGTAWSISRRVVASILPGGSKHQDYLDKLDAFAGFVDELELGTIITRDIPLIFRPFHEHTGSWFWWGNAHCTKEEYVALWRFTFHYLTDEKGLNNLLWAYSPDIFEDEKDYLERYPGDDYVDVLGLDDYHDVGPGGQPIEFLRRLRLLVSMAESRGKLAALTETGAEAIPDPCWWTQTLLPAIAEDPVASRIAWALLWRNDRPTHHYGPYPGHASVPDFKVFSEHSAIFFRDDLDKIYRLRIEPKA